MQRVFDSIEKKIKVTSLEIIVTGTKDKPYFEIKYKEVGKEDYHIGYSSYDLNKVLDWKERDFEIVNQVASEYGGGWIPCSERLPESGKENPVTKDYYKYPCIYKNGDVVDIRYFAFGRGNWLQQGKVVNEYVVAWFDIFETLPEPYKAESEE